MTRPVALTVNVTGIPEALRAERRWVLWRYQLRQGMWSKVPFQVSGAMAKSDDPSTWNLFEVALVVYRAGGFDGLGFVIGDGWACLDIDDCFVNGATVVAAANLLDHLPGYVDISPSQTGVKAFGRSERIGGQIAFKTGTAVVTTWARARYCCITGHGAGDLTADLSAFINEWFQIANDRAAFAPASDLTSTREGYTQAAEMDDQTLWCQMLGGGDDERSDKILALFRGDTSGYGHDHSHADQALVNHLAWWTNYDRDRIDRMFRQSGLMRDKWKKASYRHATIGKALR